MTVNPKSTSGRIEQRSGRAAELSVARILAAGALAGGVVHEVANLLTVVDGLRQMEQLGMTRPDAGEDSNLIDRPADRCTVLVDAFRGVFAEQDPGGGDQPLAEALEQVRVLLRTRLRGRPTRIEIDSRSHSLVLPREMAETVTLSLLLVVLAGIENCQQQDAYPGRVTLEPIVNGDACRGMSAWISGCPNALHDVADGSATGTLLQAATRLVRSGNGTLSMHPDEERGGVTIRIQLLG